jgi:pimeloyl-ACP methyl ester carboxylesterase
LGSTADIFNKCPHILTAHYHVYGINPPAFGGSDKPAPIQANYSADRLGDDVVAALNALHIENPILLGHSIAGEELSDIGTRYPHRVAALIYLDAAYSYAFYSPTSGAWTRSILDADDLRQKMLGLDSGFPSQRALNEAENADLVHIRQDLQLQQAGLNALPPPPPPGFAQKDPFAPYATAILSGEQKFTAPMRLPILAIFAEPMNRQMFRQDKSSATIAAIDAIEKDKNAHIAAFARAQPTAHIAKIANADHFLFLSNQAETLRAIEAFLAGLPVT